MVNRASKLAALAAVSAVALAGCGSSSGSGASTATSAPATSAAVTSAAATSAATSAAASSAASPAASSAASAVASVAASASAAGGSVTGKIGVILPDTITAKRWENNDRPSLEKAFKDAGLTSDIQNAEGVATKWLQICDALINEKVAVLVETDIDTSSPKKCIDKAHAQGIKVIDYDRLSIGAGADYYVSFDNVAVGKLQGEGLVKCLTDAGKTKGVNIVEINGAATDNNAKLFKQGYDSVLDPKYKSGDYKKVGDQTGGWKPDIAKTVWQQFYTANNGKIDGAIVANDGMGDGVVTAIQAEGLLGKLPFTGQDAQDSGLARVLQGQQCMTVFKDISLEAGLASKLAIALIKKSDTKSLVNTTVRDDTLNKDVPFASADSQAITKDNVNDVLKTGYTTAANVCKLATQAVCDKAGIK